MRGAVHQFDNEVVKYFTGTAGSFGSRLVFSATTGRGQKGIFGVDSDGQGLGRMQAVSNVALAPAIGPAAASTTRAASPTAATSSSSHPATRRSCKQAGLVFGVAFGGGKMAVVVSQTGQSDI